MRAGRLAFARLALAAAARYGRGTTFPDPQEPA